MCKKASKLTVLSTLILAGIVTLIVSSSAKADNIGITRDCTQNIAGHRVEAITTPLEGGNFKARLLFDGKEFPVLGNACFVSTRLGTRYVLCTFQIDAKNRIELYPITETTSGLVRFMQFVLWHGHQAQAGSFTSCIE
jgi:hypothetical protein